MPSVVNKPLCARKQGDARPIRIAELEAMAQKMVGRLNAQDEGVTLCCPSWRALIAYCALSVRGGI